VQDPCQWACGPGRVTIDIRQREFESDRIIDHRSTIHRMRIAIIRPADEMPCTNRENGFDIR